MSQMFNTFKNDYTNHRVQIQLWVPQPFAEVKLQIRIDYTNCDLESSIFNVSTRTKALF